MTVSSQDSDVTYEAGPATVFSLPFRFFNNSEISAYSVDVATGDLTLLSYGTDYTLAGAGEPEVNGNAESQLTLLSGPIATGFKLYVERTLPEEQQTDIINQGKFFPEIHENVFDRLVMLIQQLSRGLTNAMRTGVGGFWWDALGLRIRNVADPQSAGDAVNLDSMQQYVADQLSSAGGAVPLTYYFTPDGVTTSFPLPGITIGNASAYTVTLDGIDQRPELDYTINLGSDSLVFVTAPPASESSTPIIGMVRVLGYAKPVGTADGLSYQYPASGSFNRTVSSKLNEVVSILDFGASPSASAITNRSAILAAIAAVQVTGGGRVLIPRGTYSISSEIILSPIAGIGFHNLEIIGEGPGQTILNFSSAPAGTDGIGIVGWGGRFVLRDLQIKNAKASGININKGEIRTGPSWISRFTIERVIVDGATTFGFNAVQAYMGSFVDCEARNCGSHGFNMQGFHTSLHFKRCWSGGDAVYPNGGNVGSGWNLNGLIYSSFDACSADQNGGAGWLISNCASTALRSCGSESNGQEGFIVRTANTATSGIPAVAIGAQEVIFDSCIGVTNSRQTANTYANFLGIATANGIQASVRVRGCTESADANSTVALVANGVSAPVFLAEEGNTFSGSFVGSGTVSRQNNTVIGRTSLAQLTADQSVPNNADTTVAFATLYTNRMIATLVSNTIIIPAGINRVKVTVGIYWNTSSSGVRQIRINKNGSGVPGLPQLKVPGAGFNPMHITSATIEVAQGDTIGITAFQDSGAPLNIINNGATFLSVEAEG